MITHGHTECTSVPPARVLLAIAEEAFVASPYPLILSLENRAASASHSSRRRPRCSRTRSAPRSSARPPTAPPPRRCRRPRRSAARSCSRKQLPPASLKSPGSRSGKSSGALHVGEERSGASAGGGATPRSATAKLPTPRSGKSSLGSPLGGSSGASSGGKDESGEVQTLHPDLHALLYLQTLKTTPGGGRAAPSHLMSSFEEVRATNLLKGEERSGRWRAHNERYLSRVYPAAARVDSSNFEPSPFWDSGVQVCALPPSHSSHSSHILPRLTPHSPLGGADGRPQLADDAHAAHAFEHRPLPDQRRRWERPSPPARLSAPPRQGDLPPPTASEVAHLRTSAAPAGRRPSTMEARALVGGGVEDGRRSVGGRAVALPERLRDGTLLVTRVRVRLLWAELLPMPGQHRHIAHSADLAKDLHPPEAPSLGHLQGEVLQPYVTVEVHGGTFSGAASTLQSVVQGSRFKSGYADNGFAPTWEGQSCECAASHPELALLRFSVYHHSKFDATDELVAAGRVAFALRAPATASCSCATRAARASRSRSCWCTSR